MCVRPFLTSTEPRVQIELHKNVAICLGEVIFMTVSPGQQANDTHLTVWWHPNPLRYLTRGITNLLAIIQFASCKLPFHSMKKWFPICNICVKRITNVILIFLQTIRRHKREHCVHKITRGLGGRMIQRGEEEEKEEDGEIVTTQC